MHKNLLAKFTLWGVLVAVTLPLWSQERGTKLTGTPIGSPSYDYATGRSSTTVNLPACAFDGDISTFYASYNKSRTWVGLDLGTPHVITRVGWCPRNESNGPSRVQLALFEGSNSADFLDAVPLYLISETGTQGRTEYADVKVSRGFRYVRYVGPNDARSNIAELEFWGYEGEGDDSQFYQVTNLPTVSIHTYSGNDPQDKVNELESNITITYDNGTRIQEYPILTRCRGNASFAYPKKPYRIKFNDGKSHHMLKDSPLQSPAKAKKWTLINNYGDKTLMRNILAFEVSRRLQMPYTVWCQPVDVIMNGEYKGCYQLCDQITVDPNRVPVTEMEEWDNQEPELSGGYLLEIDNNYRGEPAYFVSNHNIPVTIHSPDGDDITTEQKNYIKDYFNLFETALWKDDFSDEEKGYRQYLNVESFLRNFLVNEFSGNTDTYHSTYLYKERNQSQFILSPVWDFDLAFDNDSRIYPVSSRNDWVFRTGGTNAGNMLNTASRILSDPYADRLLKAIWKEARTSGQIEEEPLIDFVDSIAGVLNASQKLEFIRWPIMNQVVHLEPVIRGSYEGEVKVLRNYITDRIEWIDDFLSNGSIEVSDSTFQISTAQELVDFAKWVKKGGNGSTAYLTADIDMTGYSDKFSPIGTGSKPFKGTFDGQGHVISNLHITGENYTGLLGVVTGGCVVQDLTFDSSCSISGNAYVGIVGGSNGSGVVTVQRVGNEANITGSAQNVSGIIGCNMSSAATFRISNCYNTGTIVGGRESGAISGWTGGNGLVTNCYNIGTVSGYDSENHYLTRGSAQVVNCYSTVGSEGTKITGSMVRSGELCFKLNGGETQHPTWHQTLGTDNHPVLLSDHKTVYYMGGTYTNGDDNMKPGDVNADEQVDEADLAALKDYLLGREVKLFIKEAADLNADNEVSVLDLIQMIKQVNQLDTPGSENVSGLPNSISVKGFRISAGNTKTVTALCTISHPFTAFQLTIDLEGKISIDPASFQMGAMKSESHILEVEKKGNQIRILGYSPENASLTSFNGNLFSFDVAADDTFNGGTMRFTNQKIGSPRGAGYSFSNFNCSISLATTLVREIVLEADTFQIDPGDHLLLSATVLPATATKKDITWSTEDPSVATISPEGELVGINNGFTTVTASATDSSKKTATAVVVVGEPSSIAIASEELKDAEIYTLTGIRVARPHRGGIYIINGRTVVIH